MPREVIASAPVRSKPVRTYNPGDANIAPDGEHIPFILSQIKEFDKELWTDVVKTLDQFGEASGLFDDVNVRRLSNTESGPFQLIVTLGGSKANIIDVGYGVSQALPIITDLIRGKDRSMFLIQQPEVHLHPRAQAELATFFGQIVQRKHHTLFVETHSDYLIDRFRMEVRDGNLNPDDISLLYFERTGLDVEIHSMTIDSAGNVRGAPTGYRQFFIGEELKSLGVD
jgi:predicted ATPase